MSHPVTLLLRSVKIEAHSLPLIPDCGSGFRVSPFVTALALALEWCLVGQMICVMHEIARTVAATAVFMKSWWVQDAKFHTAQQAG